ncbi:PEPxxWA-CTERM sorting domain-containing protein [Allopontixanthobacter sediminis]|uniref:PEPxxWA-CTERM sorting domain-containing protein n=1 Tax=Allopontixanthobacter sediminis TaxID=1689985 RepID=A0A845AYK7_9SPHN|nr:PEPxxWA-CTERM sorting domain-containing protein [Allopontixanthobacter sediminis]MXP44583.1 PEPxxWA-CTERM sorting domain-containing protein [Allopontixanthobacter sediminis]
MKSSYFLVTSAIAASLLTAVPASAATLLFDLSGSRNATFTLEVDPVVPDRVNNQPLLGGSQIFFNNVPGTFNGIAGSGNVNFGSGSILAALNISAPGLGFTQFGGADLFSFVDGRPVFNTGTFNFSGIATGRSTLIISEVSGAVPEPATWLMLILGFAAVGGSMRMKRRKTRATIAYA